MNSADSLRGQWRAWYRDAAGEWREIPLRGATLTFGDAASDSLLPPPDEQRQQLEAWERQMQAARGTA